MSIEALIRATHNRYFDELKGIALCVDRLQTGGQPAMVVEELERRIIAFSEALGDGGKQLVKEAR